MIHPDLSYALQGGLFTVQNGVGLGRPEEVYHQAFTIWLKRNGFHYISKPPYPLRYDGEIVHTLFPDLIVEDNIVIELKAKARKLQAGDWVQIINIVFR